MLIFSQDEKNIINTDTINIIEIMNETGEKEEINIIKHSIVQARFYNLIVVLGKYGTEERAKQVLRLLIWNAQVEQKNFKMPKE